MPLIFLVLGLVLIAAAVNNTHAQLISLLTQDFTGQNNFIFWIVAIGIIGAIGSIAGLKTLANLFLLLVVAVILLSNKGFFSQFSTALKQTSTSTPTQGS